MCSRLLSFSAEATSDERSRHVGSPIAALLQRHLCRPCLENILHSAALCNQANLAGFSTS